ncbi:MAG: signal peptidase I [Chloroflexota bacterium]
MIGRTPFWDMWKKLLLNKPLLRFSLSLCSIILLWALFAPSRFGGAVEYIIVDGDSMLPAFSKGDLVLLRRAAFYQVGDIVAYRYPQIGTVIHRIQRQEGQHFILKGDHNYWEDGYQPRAEEILGKLWLHLPAFGKIFAYFKNPAPFAFLAGIGTFLIGMNFLTSPASKSRKKLRPLIDSTTRAAAGWLAEKQNGYFIATYSIFILSLVLAFFAFSRPLWLTVPQAIEYQQLGTYQYSASVPEGIYDNNRLESGGAIFPRVTCQVSFQFAYHLLTPQPFNGSGQYQMDAIVSSSNGWQRTIPLIPPSTFQGSQFQHSAVLDVCQVMEMIETVEEKSGVQNFQYFLSIQPTVQFSGQMGGYSLENRFAQPLRFAIERAQIYPIVEPDVNPLQPILKHTLTIPKTIPNTLNIFGMELPVSTARWISGIGLAVALLALALPAYLIHQAEQRDEKLLARFAGAGRLVEVNNLPRLDGDHLIWMSSLDDLLRLAQQTEETIFFHLSHPSAYYFVRNEGLVYLYQKPVQPAPLSGSDEVRSEILRAIQFNEFVLYFQPIISLESGEIAQLECLLRWKHPQRGLLSPADFLGQVERAGMNPELDVWVLERVAGLLAGWEENKLPLYPVSVNISSQTLKQEEITSTLKGILENYKIAPQRVYLEIPEESIYSLSDKAEVLGQLREAGFGIALSSPSLTPLQPLGENIQINQLKLGYQTVKQISAVSQSEELARRWISIAHQHHISVVAVGIETSQQLGFFRSNQCDQAQGFIISPPLAAEDLPGFLRHNQPLLNESFFSASS